MHTNGDFTFIVDIYLNKNIHTLTNDILCLNRTQIEHQIHNNNITTFVTRKRYIFTYCATVNVITIVKKQVYFILRFLKLLFYYFVDLELIITYIFFYVFCLSFNFFPLCSIHTRMLNVMMHIMCYLNTQLLRKKCLFSTFRSIGVS